MAAVLRGEGRVTCWGCASRGDLWGSPISSPHLLPFLPRQILVIPPFIHFISVCLVLLYLASFQYSVYLNHVIGFTPLQLSMFIKREQALLGSSDRITICFIQLYQTFSIATSYVTPFNICKFWGFV